MQVSLVCFYLIIFKPLCSLGSLTVEVIISPPEETKQASSSVNLTCTVSGSYTAPLSYQWTSTCTGNCFVLQATDSSLTKLSLHSVDAGNHTCTVTDALGNSGSSTIQIRING